MNKNNDIIEIKGKLYNAASGAPLKKQPAAAAKATVKPTKSRQKLTMHDVIRAPAKHSQGHAPEPAKTLMRHAVKRPVLAAKRHFKANSAVEARQQSRPLLDKLAIKPSATRLDTKRLQHAKQIPKSRLISRFGKVVPAVPAPAASQAIPVHHPSRIPHQAVKHRRPLPNSCNMP